MSMVSLGSSSSEVLCSFTHFLLGMYVVYLCFELPKNRFIRFRNHNLAISFQAYTMHGS